MRTVLILLLCGVGVAGGAYLLWTYALNHEKEEQEEKIQQKTAAELAELRNQFNAFKETSLRQKSDYEAQIAQLSEKVALLEETVTALQKNQVSPVTVKPSPPPAVQPPPSGGGNIPQQESGAILEKRRLSEMSEKMGEGRIEKVKEVAAKLGWGDEKTASVVAILSEENRQVQALLKSYEGTPPEQIDRQAIMQQVKQIHINTLESLKQVMSEDELRRLDDIISPRSPKRIDRPERPDKKSPNSGR
ncbi:MAG: hypothetical protein N2234_00945 [Planctomycetota bacterium]|nr:hypothetical protein [Planctomycetota bacterium]